MLAPYARAKQVVQSDIIQCLQEALPKLVGAYSLGDLLTNDRLIAARDPFGFRPLVLGQRPIGDGTFSWAVASETCAFDLIGAKLVREVEPGEIVSLDDQGESTARAFPAKQNAWPNVFSNMFTSLDLTARCSA